MRRVAAASFRDYFGHYHADPRLDRAKCDETYASWAERSCVDEAVASGVLVAEHGGRVAGFLTLQARGAGEQEIASTPWIRRCSATASTASLVLAAMHCGLR